MGGNNNTDNKPPNDAAELQCKIFSENSMLAFLNPYIPHLAMAYVMFCFAGYTCMGRHLKGEGPMFLFFFQLDGIARNVGIMMFGRIFEQTYPGYGPGVIQNHHRRINISFKVRLMLNTL